MINQNNKNYNDNVLCISLEAAIKSGRRFRYGGPPLTIPNHAAQTGHVWRKFSEIVNGGTGHYCFYSKKPMSNFILLCTECNKKLRVRMDRLNLWIIEKSEDELFQDAEKILNAIGIQIKKEEVTQSRHR